MAKIWSTTVPNTLNASNSNEVDIGRVAVKPNVNGFTNVQGVNENGYNGIGRTTMNERERENLDLEISNMQYGEFWKKLRMSKNDVRVVKSVPDLTFSWEGVNAFCEKRQNIFKKCWNKLTKSGPSKQASRDREAIIGPLGKWDQTRGANDAYLHLNENKVTVISYRNSSSSSSSNNSSTAEDQSLESFSSSSSNNGSKPHFFQVLNNGASFF